MSADAPVRKSSFPSNPLTNQESSRPLLPCLPHAHRLATIYQNHPETAQPHHMWLRAENVRSPCFDRPARSTVSVHMPRQGRIMNVRTGDGNKPNKSSAFTWSCVASVGKLLDLKHRTHASSTITGRSDIRGSSTTSEGR